MPNDFTVYPAIDLLDGKCVRLRQGDYQQADVVGEDVVAVAGGWAAQGARWLHIVDLGGARAGHTSSLPAVRAVAEATGLPMQMGGGLRTDEDVAEAFAAGVSRAILGTTALRDPHMLQACLRHWGGRIAVSLDIRGGKLAVSGWLAEADELPSDCARRFADWGVRVLIVTAIERDGMLSGFDSEMLANLRAAAPEVDLIAAGGGATLADVEEVRSLGLNGAILGRSLYAGNISLREALALETRSASAH